MRFSIWPSSSLAWDEIRETAAHCEQTGWDAVYFADHFMPDGPGPDAVDGDILECWSVVSVTFRHPAVLANIAAAVDQISHGRLALGVGAGWQQNEHAAYGLALGTVRERMDRFEEAVQILRSLLSQPRTTFPGQHFRLHNAPNQPRPVQGRLPLLVGGRGERRTMLIAARYADEWNSWTTPELLAHKVSVLRSHCEQVGRDPGEIRVSTQALLYLSTDKQWLADKRQAEPGRHPVIVGTPGEVVGIAARYQQAGADELIVPDLTLGSMACKKDTCDLFMQEVAPAFR